jgi:hypothetical protein
MKKTFKILGIIALTAAIGFSMTACPPEDTYSPPPPESFITVKDMPSNYNGKIGAVKLYPIDSSDGTVSSNATVYSTTEKINGNSVTLPLYNWAEENPWLGSGDFSITIFIFENKTALVNGQTIYKGVTTETITETTTIIEWSNFTPKS